MKKGLLAIAGLLALSAGPSFAKFDPSFTWATLETPHFLIHFHQGGEEIAKKAAAIAEDVHARLVPRIGWAPKDKTRLILVDSMDEANGMATPIPYNQMVILLTQPVGEPGFGATYYDDWLRLVITHEYTHILQLDMVTKWPATLQKILGRIYFPNMWQPVWMIEGLATYEETEQTSGGRGRSPAADMVLRMAALEGPFPSIDQVSVFPDSWPAGQAPYLFGEAFTRFIAETYGRERLAEISTTYSGRGWPFLVGSTGRMVLKKNYTDLWSEWENRLRHRYSKQAEEIRAKGITPSTALSKKGYLTISPSYSPDCRFIAYSQANADEFPAILLMNSDGSGDRKILENRFPVSVSGANVSWSPDGTRIFYTKIEIQATNYYSDIYSYDIARDKEYRITKGLRARDPHISSDGKSLIFVMNRLGMNRLAKIDLGSRPKLPYSRGDVVFLTEEGPFQYETPRFSPDGGRIAVGVWQPGGFKDIWILDASGRKVDEISKDRAMDGAPFWSPDGRYIFFSSDRSGVFNIFAYETAAKRLFQVTNVIGGAFTPAVSPDGATLVFSSYSAKGYDIHKTDLDMSRLKPAEPYRDPYPARQYEEKTPEITIHPYDPLSTLYPRFWLPWFGYSKESGLLVGAFTFGQDAVQRHQYYLTALYGPKNGRRWYSLDYFYDGLAPTIHIEASDIDMTYSSMPTDNYGNTEDYVERRKTYGISVIAPFLRVSRQQYATLGYRWTEATHLSDISGWSMSSSDLVPKEGVMASARLSYLFNNSRRYGFSISPEHGRMVELAYERLDKSLGGAFEIHKYTADWREYISPPLEHHVFLARVFAATSSGDIIPQRAFQLGGDDPGDVTISLDEQNVHLRGYPVNQFRGQKACLATLEYRFPLQNIEQGWDTKPFFCRRIHAALFAETGNAWDGSFRGSDLKRSIGAEARFDFYLAYYLPVTIRVGIASGLDEGGETLSYIGLWVPVLF